MTTKREIVKAIAEKTALTQGQTREVVQLTFDAIMQSILEEGRIELRNFGVFEVKWRRARKARDPRSGETMDVPPRHVVVFRPGRTLEEGLAELPKPKNA